VTRNNLRRALEEFYREIEMLKSFISLNQKAVYKIKKKHKKKRPDERDVEGHGR
jgi:SPX domain protein involved in polyphosphate accumulation